MKQTSPMEIQKVAAFSHNNQGGNPAGVVVTQKIPTAAEMLKIAKQVGYSETAFLNKTNSGWRIRYFAPEMEVPFCGHATIASGAVLGKLFGAGVYKFILNEGTISINVSNTEADDFTVSFTSPETWSKPAPKAYVQKIINAFSITERDLDERFPIRFAFAGAKHLILVFKRRQKLSEISYCFEELKNLMQQEGLVTVNLLWEESIHLFHSRNPFPTGGVYEDPATGAAAAAFAGYLRDIKFDCKNHFSILQGEDMGSPSQLTVDFNSHPGEGIKVSGKSYFITEEHD